MREDQVGLCTGHHDVEQFSVACGSVVLAKLGGVGRVWKPAVRRERHEDRVKLEPLCRVMVEGPTAEKTEHICRSLAEIVRASIG